jgi:hypothetical protein
MSDEMRCEQVRELAPELALDIAGGQERDAALRHMSGCAECRRFVGSLSTIGDEVLLLAPEHEPPAGFSDRVLDRLAKEQTPEVTDLRPGRRRNRRLQVLAVAAAVVLAAFTGAASVLVATAGDRRLADGYRAVLAQGNGSFFAAAPIEGPEGRAGTAFGYQGSPSWILVTVDGPEVQTLRAEIVTGDGRYLALGDAQLGGGEHVWGSAIPVGLSEVRQILFLGADGRPVYQATLNAGNPWGSTPSPAP